MFFSHTDGLKKYKELYLQLENISFYIHIKELPLKFIIIIIYRLFCIFFNCPPPPCDIPDHHVLRECQTGSSGELLVGEASWGAAHFHQQGQKRTQQVFL